MKDLEHITESNKEDNLKTLLINGSLMLGAFVLRQGIEAGYKMINGNSAPKNPEEKHSNWTKALLYGMAAGALLGAAKVIMRPGVNAGVDKILSE